MNTNAGAGFSDLLSLIPDVTELHIPLIDTESLRKLILDRSSADPVLPKLKTFALVDHEMGHRDDRVNAIDPTVFTQVIWSRTIALSKILSSEPSLEEQFQILDTVELHLGQDRIQQIRVRLLQAELGGGPPDPTAASLSPLESMVASLDTLAERFEKNLENNFLPKFYDKGGYSWKSSLKLDKRMREMESLTLENFDRCSPILLVRRTLLLT
ncbi:hypothetical protein H1R20_g145, partial [Candolleomyces eurysporus]